MISFQVLLFLILLSITSAFLRPLSRRTCPRDSSSTHVISVSTIETDLGRDYLGMLNFCLRRSDSALSGQSRSKLLNELTNEVFKAIMIGYPKAIADVLEKLSANKDKIKLSKCFLGEEDGGVPSDSEEITKACDLDLKKALDYVNSLEKLIMKGEINTEINGGIYDRGYNRLITQFRDIGCAFVSTGVRPVDNDICLSMLDNCLENKMPTKTRELNNIANWVLRAIIYGEATDRSTLADAIDSLTPSFADTWLKSDMKAQEVVFLQALGLLLREGVATAEAAIIYTENSSDRFGESDISGSLSEVVNIIEPPLRLRDPYLNTFQRIVSLCLRDLGERNWAVQDEEVLDTFSQWEQSFRQNFTSSTWIANPVELTGKWTMLDIGGKGELDPFLAEKNPSMNSLDIPMKEDNTLDGASGISNKVESTEVEVEFCRDGSLNLSPVRGSGSMWRFKPGPAHLDTCEFSILSSSDPDLILKYVGYIDRGQRTECRFSGRPIRMTGSVQSFIKGVQRGSMRFVMQQKKKGNQWGG
mmetsp:Transcript_34231/g.34883  ORF Transcript_34231/g.34883 Transcript_34231/m.34883 type:complete len:530 (-) Transcript_34231:284-1873(-)